MHTTICTLSLVLAGLAMAPAQTSDEKAVRAVVQQYFRGHATADPAEMRKAFHPTAHIEGNRDGKFVSWTAEQYSANFTGKPAADEASRKRTIDSVAISGDGQRDACPRRHHLHGLLRTAEDQRRVEDRQQGLLEASHQVGGPGTLAGSEKGLGCMVK